MNRTLPPDYIQDADTILAGIDTVVRSLLSNRLGTVETTLKAALLVILIRRDATSMRIAKS